MKTILSYLQSSILLTLIFAVVLCGAYPLAVWAAGQGIFHDKANGSLIIDANGTVRGSRLLAQNFSEDKYFQPRPSAAGAGYDAANSSGTNLGPTSAKLAQGIHATDTKGKPISDLNNFDGIADLVQAYRKLNHLEATASVPADAVTRSASGLDPHISTANAEIQAKRVADARHIPLDRVLRLIAENTDSRDLGFLGEPGVNVLTLNLALDRN
ncbi:MAG TPA: K(+)-transporting ATPase subunit C [Opitutaceae bacterium]